MNSINEILNSDFFKKEILDIEKEKKELEKDGWSYDEIRNMAEFIIKNKKNV